MHRLVAKIPFWIPWLFPSYVWRVPTRERVVYLTFDDGPHPAITPWVLDQLATFGAKASFFCIGKNVEAYPGVYRQVLDAGHAVGNHTQNHLNGWHTETGVYVENVKAAAQVIASPLFRPPYGRIRKGQAAGVKAALGPDAQIIMWDVLSADFDRGLTPAQCLRRVVRHCRAGSILVFHDSEKAFKNLETLLPQVLHYLSESGFRMEALPGRYKKN